MTSRLCISSFSLRDTLECGQFFRFTRVGDTYVVQSSGRIFTIHQRKDVLVYEGVNESFLVDFFRLGEDLDTVLKEIDRDPIVHRAIERYRGLRLIRQEPWECLISYLCSSAKAIPHIRSILERLSRSSGKRMSFGNYIGYDFPEPLCLVSSEGVASAGAGFRAAYLKEVARCIDRQKLAALKSLRSDEARRSLMALPGVGKKVANCTMLYSLDFLEAFPIDTWIRKGLEKAYFRGERVREKDLEAFVSRHFGPFAGVAQLYLYHYWRHHPITP